MGEINPEVVEILKEFRINKDAGILCLLGIHYGLDVDTVVPEEVVKAVNLTKIVEKDYTVARHNLLKWNVPLFQGQMNEWSWVRDWNDRWKVAPDRKASNPDVLKRMQDFFKKYPHIRKEDVINATDLYFRGVSSPQYLKNSAAFIFDGAGAAKKSILLGFCERVTSGVRESSNQKGKVIQ